MSRRGKREEVVHDERKHPSYFPNMTFAPGSFPDLETNTKADPMVKGMSDETLAGIKVRLAELKKKRMVPESYSIHNSVQVCICVSCYALYAQML
mgnify:CR=1 FL=1